MQEIPFQFLGQEDPLEKGKAPHSSVLAWRIPWTAWSMGSQGATFTFTLISIEGMDFSFNDIESKVMGFYLCQDTVESFSKNE